MSADLNKFYEKRNISRVNAESGFHTISSFSSYTIVGGAQSDHTGDRYEGQQGLPPRHRHGRSGKVRLGLDGLAPLTASNQRPERPKNTQLTQGRGESADCTETLLHVLRDFSVR